MFKINLRSFFSTKKNFILLFGAPGVGKGVFARLLEKDLGLLYLSTNEQLRKVMRETYTNNGLKPSLIQKLRKVVKSGGLIDDDLVIELVRQKSMVPSAEKGLILSGFPRNEAQFKAIQNKYQISAAINLTLRDDILLKQIQGRRYCIPCSTRYHIENIRQEDYNLQFNLPKDIGKCSSCEKELSVREDDNLRVAKARIQQYHKRTKPILSELQKLGRLIHFQTKKGEKDYPQLLTLVLNKIS